jgi:hypothetical protein
LLSDSFFLISLVAITLAGPAVGFVLWQIYFHITSFVSFDSKRSIRENEKDKFNTKYEFERAYAHVRLACDDTERSELDSLQGRYVFGMSTAVGLWIIALYSLLTILIRMSFLQDGSFECATVSTNSILCGHMIRGLVITASIVIVGLILIFGADFDNRRVRIPTICTLVEKYTLQVPNLEVPKTCRDWKNQNANRMKKQAKKLIKAYAAKNQPLKQSKLVEELTNSNRFSEGTALQMLCELYQDVLKDTENDNSKSEDKIYILDPNK